MVEHVNIIDSERHEAKGASTASANQVLHANGDGTTTFKFLDYANLLNKPLLEGYERLFFDGNTASQSPVAVNTPIKISFGTGVATADAQLATDGVITFLTNGQYLISVFLRFGRTSGAGSSVMFNRIVYNGTQALNTNCVKLTDAEATVPFSANLIFDAVAGDTVYFELMRDSSGINNGGLVATTPSVAGWGISPSATVVVHKFSGS